MQLSDFDYSLPKKFIAQKPLEKRDQSKLMVLNRKKKLISHHQFFELPDLLDKNTILVFNESKVIPARLKFKIGEGKAEILLIKSISENIWECMVKPGPKFIPQSYIKIDSELSCNIESITPNGLRIIKFHCDNFKEYLKKHGHTPLPPYIKEDIDNPDKYQTIYAKNEGSVAAPTAGFHFTDNLFNRLKEKGIQKEFINLHVGMGTFQPVKTDKIEDHKMHSEFFELSEDTTKRLNEAKNNGKKIIAVGTTSIRVLESCSNEKGELIAKTGETDIFIYPGYKWKYIDGIITNFHVPKSTLLMLISSFASREFILNAYEEAKLKNYRFFSFGDSMLII
ncbi:tRNA preQ1(34) S-adenosylmethionine ribosyltransferase-isomerase QueA [Candidatus Peregrinibacteria bacterium]|nr:tRNA preQ1(34) S-adenosylmethionine ribosyltransferase-isomerase QueA [Candidatus Peregrinibacteria bacterium]